jgi:hypothetical protein
MAYGAWLPWAHLQATLVNINRDRKKRPTPVTAIECHPMEKQKRSDGIPLTGDMAARIGDMLAKGKEAK